MNDLALKRTLLLGNSDILNLKFQDLRLLAIIVNECTFFVMIIFTSNNSLVNIGNVFEDGHRNLRHLRKALFTGQPGSGVNIAKHVIF